MSDLTALYREDATWDEHVEAYQTMIDNGQAWLFEGSVGREAMALLKNGYCTLPEVRHKDYWGNTVPSRHDVEPGSFGTLEFVAKAQAERDEDIEVPL